MKERTNRASGECAVRQEPYWHDPPEPFTPVPQAEFPPSPFEHLENGYYWVKTYGSPFIAKRKEKRWEAMASDCIGMITVLSERILPPKG